ncbi:hypothetical protein EV646_103415 [Kribbella antiqua]|uniref:Uncharacterized protein n=1 Tax=Kribbella antiqua TaxID=2512217 RepID=A0A4R2IY99_9ACTN|nr:hypothetical protein [Kribbella antiqua]TCO49436.1 hypothetical protein EV646_103415 [Kribbella antiqua]
MKPTEFVKVNSQFWGDHLRSVSEHLPGSHGGELPGELLYPRMMVLTETPDWNIVELVGVSREYRSLEVRRQKADSIEQYFGLDAAAPSAVVTLPGENLFKDATIATESGRRTLTSSFPAAENIIGGEYVGPGDQLLQFAPGNYSTFDRVLLVHTADSSVRVHWTFFALAIHRSEPAEQYLNFLQNYISAAPHLDPVGTLTAPLGSDLKPAGFASTYLAHGLQGVDQFLEDHESILLSAFDATRLIRRPSLESEGAELTPDFILERADGSHIVGDLQLPLLESRKHRRSFKSPVADGAAQLARYEDYFKSAENRAFAKTKYDVDISDPRKVLIISTQQPVAPDELKQAAAEVVDYDSILRLYLAAKS